MKCVDYELRACRDRVFDRLCTVWDVAKNSGDWNEIWRKANTLQAVAQYWHTTTDDDRRKKAMTIISEGYAFTTPRRREGGGSMTSAGGAASLRTSAAIAAPFRCLHRSIRATCWPRCATATRE
jgi:hypothetical protein